MLLCVSRGTCLFEKLENEYDKLFFNFQILFFQLNIEIMNDTWTYTDSE